VCRFVDPIADIAVLGSPDNPHADDYKALMGDLAGNGEGYAPGRRCGVREYLAALDHVRTLSLVRSKRKEG
jgi:hypothetical protein